MLRVLFITSLFSTPQQPTRSPPNTRIARAMKRNATIRVISPLPYYPKILVKGRPDLCAVAKVPTVEQDVDGDDVVHPRYLHIPKIGRCLYPFLYAASIARSVAQEVIAFQPDVILSAWAFPDGVAAVALAKTFGIPSVLRVMGSDINAFAQEPLRRIQIVWALRNASRVIAVSDALANSCVELAGESRRPFVDIIPTGVDAKTFHRVDWNVARSALGIPIGRRVIVVPARLSFEKGVHYFLDALATLDKNLHAILVGGGPEIERLRAQVRSLSLEDRVEFVGYQSEERMRLYYSAADLVCLPSTEEGWPNVLVESFACGCPWVASDVGGVPEIQRIADGGLLAKPGDASDLARVLKKALAREWDRGAIAEQGVLESLDDTAKRYVAACETASFMYGPPDLLPTQPIARSTTSRQGLPWTTSQAS